MPVKEFMTAECPGCGMQSPYRLAARDYNQGVTRTVFIYHRCPACGIVFLPSAAADLDRHYPSRYYAIPVSPQALARAAEAERWKLDFVRQFRSSGSLLDIGPAYGLFAYLAKLAGFLVEVVERDAGCCEFLRDVVGIESHESSDVVLALESRGGFDVVTLWQAIEHLPEAWKVLRTLGAKLLPGALVIVATPNPMSLQFAIFQRFWAHLDAPRHLQLIPPLVLSRQMEEVGFRCIHLTATDAGSLGWNSFGWAMSLRNLAGDNPLGRAAHFLGRVVNRVIAPYERRGLRGSCYTAVFEKAPM